MLRFIKSSQGDGTTLDIIRDNKHYAGAIERHDIVWWCCDDRGLVFFLTLGDHSWLRII